MLFLGYHITILLSSQIGAEMCPLFSVIYAFKMMYSSYDKKQFL